MLEVEIFGQVIPFEIFDGQRMILGSDSACNLHVQGSGIAARHLSIAYQEETIDIIDLESDEGTYRMPQGAPFVEYKSVENSMIELKLGETLLRLRWKMSTVGSSTQLVPAPQSHSSSQSEKPTRVSSGDPRARAPMLKSPMPVAQVKASVAVSSQKKDAVVSIPESNRPSARATPNLVEMSIDTRLRAFENLFLLFFLAAVFRVLSELRDKMTAWQMWSIPDYYRRGVSLDCLYLYWKEPFFWRTLCLGVAGVFLFLILIGPLSRMMSNRFGHLLSSRVLLVFSGLRGARWIGFLVSIVLFFWTPFLAFDLGFQKSDVPFFKQVSEHLKNKPGEYFDFEKVPAFYKGSSLLYKVWVLSEREQLVNRCRAFGLDTWAGQKQCSVLFFSKTLEGYARFQPRISQSLATSQVILACLDGLIRVMSLEGPDSPIVYLFLDPLDRVGLSAERKRIVDYIASYNGLDFENMMKGLIEMKHRLEAQADQAANDLPKALRVRFPGPIELGI